MSFAYPSTFILFYREREREEGGSVDLPTWLPVSSGAECAGFNSISNISWHSERNITPAGEIWNYRLGISRSPRIYIQYVIQTYQARWGRGVMKFYIWKVSVTFFNVVEKVKTKLETFLKLKFIKIFKKFKMNNK